MRYVYRPLPAVWPSGQRTREYERKGSPFRVGHENTLRLLERELRHLGVQHVEPVVIEAGYRETDLRMDGLPRKDARLLDPAVVLSFLSKHGPLRYGCDTYRHHDANIRAIALALEALRAVDRYGVTKRGEQYQGWRALPSSTMDPEEAARTIYDIAGLTTGDTTDLERAYRWAAKRAHPDVGGDREKWDRLQRAKEALAL